MFIHRSSEYSHGNWIFDSFFVHLTSAGAFALARAQGVLQHLQRADQAFAGVGVVGVGGDPVDGAGDAPRAALPCVREW